MKAKLSVKGVSVDVQTPPQSVKGYKTVDSAKKAAQRYFKQHYRK